MMSKSHLKIEANFISLLAMNLSLKISGVVLLIAGFILTIKPDLLAKFAASVDGYQMIEKRVKWGILIGLGIFLIYYHNGNSWKSLVAALVTALTFGIIIARLAGFVLDGFFVRQIWWLLIELAVFTIFGFLYWKYKL